MKANLPNYDLYGIIMPFNVLDIIKIIVIVKNENITILVL